MYKLTFYKNGGIYHIWPTGYKVSTKTQTLHPNTSKYLKLSKHIYLAISHRQHSTAKLWE